MSASRRPRTPPSKGYAARVARGRVPVMVYLSPEAAERLGEVAEATGETRSAIVEAALRALAEPD